MLTMSLNPIKKVSKGIKTFMAARAFSSRIFPTIAVFATRMRIGMTMPTVEAPSRVLNLSSQKILLRLAAGM